MAGLLGARWPWTGMSRCCGFQGIGQGTPTLVPAGAALAARLVSKGRRPVVPRWAGGWGFPGEALGTDVHH